MNALNSAAVATLLTLSLDACWDSGPEAAMAKTYHMTLSGDADARFSGQCTLETNDGEAVLSLLGTVPFEQEVVGHGLSCHVETEGRVVLEIDHNGSRTRSATNGGKINISLR